MVDLDKHELVAATVAELVTTFGDEVVVTWVDASTATSSTGNRRIPRRC